MQITPVTKINFTEAVHVYRDSWRESHKDICSIKFLQCRDYETYLQNHLQGMYLLTDPEPVGIVRIFSGALSDLYIHPQKQGRGYGRILVSFATAHNATRLTVLSSNKQAIALYQKMGFSFTGNEKQLRHDLWELEMKLTEKNNG